MNRIHFFPLVLLAAFSSVQAHGQADRSNPAGPVSSSPELNVLTAEYTARQRAIDSEIEPQLKTAAEGYLSDLAALVEKLEQGKRIEDSDKVRKERERFVERGLLSEPAKSAPPDVRAAWRNLLKADAEASKSVATKRAALRTEFIRNLVVIEERFRRDGDLENLAFSRRIRAILDIRELIAANRISVTDLGGKGSNPWSDIVKEGGYVVGFRWSRGVWFQFSVLGSLKPIFVTASGLREGESRGGSGGEKVLAKEGYAVGGLIVRGGDVVNCVRVMFMRINSDGASLNPKDFYLSEWLGGEGGGKPKELASRGNMVVGVTGASTDVVNSIGLVYVR